MLWRHAQFIHFWENVCHRPKSDHHSLSVFQVKLEEEKKKELVQLITNTIILIKNALCTSHFVAEIRILNNMYSRPIFNKVIKWIPYTTALSNTFLNEIDLLYVYGSVYVCVMVNKVLIHFGILALICTSSFAHSCFCTICANINTEEKESNILLLRKQFWSLGISESVLSTSRGPQTTLWKPLLQGILRVGRDTGKCFYESKVLAEGGESFSTPALEATRIKSTQASKDKGEAKVSPPQKVAWMCGPIKDGD